MAGEGIDFEEDARRFAPNGYLLDTCALLWVANEPERLSKRAAAIWRTRNTFVAVSVISYWEIAIKERLHKYRGRGPVVGTAREALHRYGAYSSSRGACQGASGSSSPSQRSIRPHANRAGAGREYVSGYLRQANSSVRRSHGLVDTLVPYEAREFFSARPHESLLERSCRLFARNGVGHRTITLAEGRASKTCTLALVDRDTTL